MNEAPEVTINRLYARQVRRRRNVQLIFGILITLIILGLLKGCDLI